MIINSDSSGNYLNPADDQNKMVETAAHEGGHAAYALSNPFSDWVWGILSENEGHDKHNGSGKRASAEQSQANAFLRGLSLSDWERIASEFNKNKK